MWKDSVLVTSRPLSDFLTNGLKIRKSSGQCCFEIYGIFFFYHGSKTHKIG